VRKLNVRILFRHAADRFAPELRGVEDVGLVDRADGLAALARRLERDAGDALDLVLGVAHDVLRIELAAFFNGRVLAEIGSADELADDDEVDALVRDFGLERAGLAQLREDLCRTQVRVKTHARAQTQQATLRALFLGHAVPLRPADGGEQHAVRG